MTLGQKVAAIVVTILTTLVIAAIILPGAWVWAVPMFLGVLIISLIPLIGGSIKLRDQQVPVDLIARRDDEQP